MNAAPAADRIRGIGEPLPAGERLLWQGAPAWRSLAVRRFHVRKIAVYFLILIAWRATMATREPEPLAYLLAGAIPLVAFGALAIGAVCLFAWLVARTSIYAVTDRRVVMRVGVALPSLLNIPLHLVGGASHRPFADGTGDLALALDPDNRFAWMLLWPHSRPWRFSEPEPVLLCVPGSAAVGDALRTALAADAERQAADAATRPADAGQPAAATPLKLVSVR